MSKLVLNNMTLDLNTFSHNMSYRNDIMSDTIYAAVTTPLLKTLVGTSITYIAVRNSYDEIIYELTDLNATLQSINVTINQDEINTNINIVNT